ncbi:hypothetical protein [Oceanobacillus massiliensis]
MIRQAVTDDTEELALLIKQVEWRARICFTGQGKEKYRLRSNLT